MTIRRRLLCALSLAVWLIGGASAWAADTWVEVKSANFTVVSNAGEKRTRELAWQFEQIRAAVLQVWPALRGDLDRPVLVVAAKDENTMKLLTPQYWEDGKGIRPSSVLVTGPDRHYVALRADARSDDTDSVTPYSTTYWAYSALLLDASFERDLPTWLRNGLAGLLSNTIVRPNEIRVGMPPPWYLRTIANDPRLRLQQLLAVTRDTPYYRNSETRARFDAQTWALIHYFLFGSPENAAKTNTLLDAVIGGTPSMDAVQQTFGSLDAIESAYMVHVRKGLMPYSRIKVETRIAVDAFSFRPLPDADAATARAALHTVMGRTAEATALIAESRRSADTPGSYEVEAMLADRAKNRDAMVAALAKAEQLGTTNFYSLYRLAVAELPRNPDAAATSVAERRLQKVIELNPRYASAHIVLANVLANGSAAERSRAVPPAQKAVTLAPTDPFARLALARALWNAGQREPATAQARAALPLAQTDEERRQAQEMVDFFAKNSAAPR